MLLTRPESSEELLAGIDRILGGPMPESAPESAPVTDGYATVGLGAQILNDLGVGKIHLMGAPLKYNALAGFGIEVLDFVTPEQVLTTRRREQ